MSDNYNEMYRLINIAFHSNRDIVMGLCMDERHIWGKIACLFNSYGHIDDDNYDTLHHRRTNVDLAAYDGIDPKNIVRSLTEEHLKLMLMSAIHELQRVWNNLRQSGGHDLESIDEFFSDVHADLHVRYLYEAIRDDGDVLSWCMCQY